MRALGRVLLTLHMAARLAGRFVESPLSVPIAVAFEAGAGMCIANGIAVGSPTMVALGAIAAFALSVVLFVGHGQMSAGIAEDRASLLALRRQRQIRHMRGEGPTVEWKTSVYKVATEPKGGDR